VAWRKAEQTPTTKHRLTCSSGVLTRLDDCRARRGQRTRSLRHSGELRGSDDTPPPPVRYRKGLEQRRVARNARESRGVCTSKVVPRAELLLQNSSLAFLSEGYRQLESRSPQARRPHLVENRLRVVVMLQSAAQRTAAGDPLGVACLDELELFANAVTRRGATDAAPVT